MSVLDVFGWMETLEVKFHLLTKIKVKKILVVSKLFYISKEKKKKIESEYRKWTKKKINRELGSMFDFVKSLPIEEIKGKYLLLNVYIYKK